MPRLPYRILSRCLSRLLRFGATLQPAGRALRVEERLMLGGKKSLTLFVCHGRRFLLAASGDVLTPLVEVLPLPEDRFHTNSAETPKATGQETSR